MTSVVYSVAKVVPITPFLLGIQVLFKGLQLPRWGILGWWEGEKFPSESAFGRSATSKYEGVEHTRDKVRTCAELQRASRILDSRAFAFSLNVGSSTYLWKVGHEQTRLSQAHK